MDFIAPARNRAPSAVFPAVRRIAAGFLAAGFLTTGPARGADTPTYLQMAGMTALAATADGRRSNIPVTVFLQVDSTEAAGEICRRVPTVRSVVLDATSQQPIPHAKGQLDSEAVAGFVVGRINAALGGKTVARVGFVHGTPKEAAATTTDLAEAGDMTARDKTVKTGQIGQMAPCRRIVAPPASLKWVSAGTERKPSPDIAPSEPPLRENRSLAPPPSEFKSHPQFAPPAPTPGPKPRSEAPLATPPPAAPIAGVGVPRQVQADTPLSVRDCVPLDKLWKPSRYPYAGVLYALSRVFTIDSDGDRQIDNIGFVLSAPDRPDIIFRYFDEPGRAAIDLFPSLALKDPRSISGICFGQFDLGTLEAAASSQFKDRLAIDILQPSPSPAPLVRATGAGFWIFLLVAIVGLMGAMLAAVVLVRRRRAAKATAMAMAENADDDDDRADRKRDRRGDDRRKKSTPVQAERRASPDRRGKK